MTSLNPFPGYPVATIAGHLDWTAPTAEIEQALAIAEEFVDKWQSRGIAARGKEASGSSWIDVPLGDQAAVIQISGDYGTGKTHVLLQIDKSLREGFAERKVKKRNILRVAGIEADPASWYQNSIGPVLNDLGGRSPDGGWFAQLALEAYAEAARAFLPSPEELTDPATAFQLVRSGILNATSVDQAYADLINKVCDKFSETVRSQLIALLDRGRRDAAEQWLIGNPAPSAPSPEFRDGEVIDVLAGAAALSVRVGVPFAVLIDEIELFLRVDDRSGKETNTTWLKRLLSELANAGALVAVSGHRSAWDRRTDFLQRFSFGKRIEMRRLLADDVLKIVLQRVGSNRDLVFDQDEANAIVEATRGNMRRVLSLSRALFDQSDGFTKRLTSEEIRNKAIELSHAPKPDQVILKVQELFEERKLSIGKDLLRSRGLSFDFDLVASSGAKSYFAVMVRPTPSVKEAQDFARQFLAQLSAAKRRGERFTALFICDTPADRDYVGKANEPRGIAFAWIDYTDARFINEVAQAVDRQLAPEKILDEAIPPTDRADFESLWSARLDEIDRRRTAELKELQDRLALAMQAAEAASKSAEKAAEVGRLETSRQQVAGVAPQPTDTAAATRPPWPPGEAALVQPFSAAELFEKPTLGFRLRLLLGPNLAIVIPLLILGVIAMAFSSELASLVIPEGDLPFNRPYYNGLKLFWVAFGAVVIVVPLVRLLRSLFEIENYFDHASRLIKEYYLAAPHPRLLAGADRLSRELILLHGPEKALGMLTDELAKLVARSQLRPATARADSAAAANFTVPAS